MKLIYSCNQNRQRCNNPVTSSGKLRDYTKILLVVKNNPTKEFKRIELLDLALPEKQFGLKIRSGFWTERAGNATFASMSTNKLLKYSHKTQRWTKGVNFDAYMSEYVPGL